MARSERRERARPAGAGRGARAGGDRGVAPPQEAPSASAGERVCSVALCPIGLALGALQGAAPEATAHLLRAAQELLLAVRAVVDERAGAAGAIERLERIEVS